MNKKEIVKKTKSIVGKKIKHAQGVADIAVLIAKENKINEEKI
jgi:HD superfamily phosphohydrolase YqeK